MPLKTDIKRAGFSTGLGQRIVFFGNECLATGIECKGSILQSLIEYGHHIEALVLKGKPSKKKWAVEDIAESKQIPIIWVASKQELETEAESFTSETAVLASFGMIITKQVLDSFTFGIVNVHPSLLPQYRGSSPIEQAILDGLSETGVSFMKLNEQMDQGPLYVQESVQIAQGISKQGLYEQILGVSTSILPNLIVDIVSRTAQPIDQIGTASYTPLIKKSDGILSVEHTAVEAVQKIRAYSGWPKVKMLIGDVWCGIIQADEFYDLDSTQKQPIYFNGQALIVELHNSAIGITKLQPNGKKPMSAKDFANGYL